MKFTSARKWSYPFPRNFKQLHKQSFRLVFTFYSPDGNELSMAIACLSAYIKKVIPDIDIHLVIINTSQNSNENTVPGYVKRVSDLKPDLVAISCMSPHWKPLDPYLHSLKNALPQTPILIGGYQAILEPEKTINHPSVDFICVGDGELPLAELIRYMRGERGKPIPGLWEHSSSDKLVRSQPVLTEDLTTMPFPDYTLFDNNGNLREMGLSIFGPQKYFILPVMTGRGCPYHCTYCSNSSLLELYQRKGNYLRKYDPETLIVELCRLRDLYNVEFFEFWDEMFLSNIKYAWHFLKLYKKKIGLPFSINSRVEKMDEKFCQTAKEAGCHIIWFGIESGSEQYRKQYLKRTMTNDQIIEAAKNARKTGIRRLTFNIVGMPFETRENMLETLEINRLIQPEYFFFFPYIPLNGTQLYEIAKTSNLLLDNTAEHYLEGLNKGVFRLNIREHPEGVSNKTFNEVCQEMLQFSNENNHLDKIFDLQR